MNFKVTLKAVNTDNMTYSKAIYIDKLKSAIKKIAPIWLSIAIIYIIGFPAMLISTMPAHNWLVYYHLYRYGKVTTGVITEVHPENHDSYYYTYAVDGRKFNGIDTNCCTVHPNTPVRVTYLPQNPSISCADSPYDKLSNEIESIFVGLIMFPSLLTVAIMRWRRISKTS